MGLLDTDPERDVEIVLDAVRFLRQGCTLRQLETINGVSYQPGTRFGTALATAVERGLVVFDGDRYRLATHHLYRGTDLIGAFTTEAEALRELTACQGEAIAEQRSTRVYRVEAINDNEERA